MKIDFLTKHHSFKPCTHEDGDIIYKWLLDPSTREFSGNPSTPDYQSHMQWWINSVNSNSKKMFMIWHDGCVVGMIRFDHHVDKKWIVSLMIDPTIRGLGHGKVALENAIYWFNRYVMDGNVDMFYARIDERNIASIKCFTWAGFTTVAPFHDEYVLPVEKTW